MDTVKAYYWLTKPGIIYGNLLAVGSGFFIAASRTDAYLALLAETAAAIALVIASACVFNNYIDRDIDKAMKRTSWRALASDTIPVRSALIFAFVLGLAGFTMLAAFTNRATFIVGLVGFIDYVAVYAWAKRRSWHGTLVGSVSGSAPLVAGYTAVTARFDAGALLLFLIMAFWQMPHFYAIAMRRLKDYKAANIPVLPAVKGMRAAKSQIIIYITAFMAADILLYALGYAGRFFAVVMGFYATIWLSLGVKGLSAANDKRWAKKMFLYSLIFLPLLLALSIIGFWLS